MPGKKWILLVAGSKGWENYKHQANVCCLYQIIKKHGIPDEQIVVMMYSLRIKSENPKKGSIISVVDSKDVYGSVPTDYTGENLTSQNFLAALQGKAGTGRKVIASGKDDNIYVYMSGLGTNGTFEFPAGPLRPDDLIDTINKMSQGNKFSKMVIFMDSSYSASTFKELSETVNVFALCSCGPYTEVTPSTYDDKREVYLSDTFSAAWLKFTSTADFEKETFCKLVDVHQSDYMKRNAPKPCPLLFGNKEISKCHLSEFLQN